MQESTALNPTQPIIGGLIYEDVYNNGGSWLMSGKKIETTRGYRTCNLNFLFNPNGNDQGRKGPCFFQRLIALKCLKCQKIQKNI